MVSRRVVSRVCGLLASAAMVASTMASALPASASPVVVRDGLTAATAAASCWDIKQNSPASVNGTYWLLTPAMDAPAQFYCDQSTDGGGWVLVGKGREGWKVNNNGVGSKSALQTAGLSPMSGATSQYSATVVENLLNGSRPDALPDGIRLKRAMNADGSQWQEVRFNTNKEDRWVWTFSAEHVVAWYSFNGVRGSGGQTTTFGSDNAYNRVNTNTLTDVKQNYTQGFSYGTSVTGTNAATTYLWSATNGGGSARPYTEMYLRPQISSLDPGFARIGDTGTTTKTNVPVAASTALDSPWGVAGPVSPKREGDVEVQAFVQSGNTMYVGGNFTSVQRTATSTGADKVAQSFLAAFYVSTGELISGFAPKLDGSVMTLTVLPNGDIVAGGMFGNANGAPAASLVALDPVTGATATNWAVTMENRVTGGVLRVSDLAVNGNWLYLGGAFTHLTSAAHPLTTIYARNAARVSVVDGTPDANWNPNFDGTVVAIDPAPDGGRLYAAGYFANAGTATATRAAAVQTVAGAPLATPVWTPTFSNSNNYQQAIGAIGNRVWLGGSEHSLFSYSPSTFALLSGNIGKSNGDFQTITASQTGIVYAGSHGKNYNYSNAYTWSNVGTGWTEADSFDFIGAWNADTGQIVPTFTPTLDSRLGRGVWASTVDSNGTLWAGGDLTAAATKTAITKWAGGMARFPQTDATAPIRPANLALSSATPTTAKLTWIASTDNAGSVSYQVLRDDRVIATTSATSLTVPLGGENRFFVRAVDAAGNLSASTAVVVPSSNAAPTASFLLAANNQTVSFDGSGSTDDVGIAAFAWDFGDGTTGTGPTPSHTYPAAGGTFTATLKVTDDQGATGTTSRTFTLVAGPVTTAVVPAKSAWSWKYDATAPDPTWKNPGFNAFGWNSGPAPLGYGSSSLGTNLNPSTTTASRPLAAYFLRTFNLDSVAPLAKLTIQTVADDGVVVYVNGTEVGRSNMPAGAITPSTYASAAVNTTTANAKPVTFDVPLSLLVQGTNTVAAETHVNYRATPDLSFDLMAVATATGP